MKKRSNSFSFISLLAASLIITSCGLAEYGLDELFFRDMPPDKRADTLTVLTGSKAPSVSAGEIYDVLLISDVHFGRDSSEAGGPRREADWFSKLQTPDSTGRCPIDSVKFAICLGDVADHGKQEEYAAFNTEIRDKLAAIPTLAAPQGIQVYSVTGNHDLYNSGWATWSVTQNPGTSFYKFTTPSFSWYFLDSGSGSLGEKQFTALEADMTADSNKKLVFTHVPIYADDGFYFTMQNPDERNRLISLCASTDTVYFVDGHVHRELVTDFGKFIEYNMPSLLDQYSYGILHIDEAAVTARIVCMSY